LATTHRQGSAWSDAGRVAKAGAAAAAAARREPLAQRAASSARELAITLITSSEDGKIGGSALAEADQRGSEGHSATTKVSARKTKLDTKLCVAMRPASPEVTPLRAARR
jgi:hypothetical protein